MPPSALSRILCPVDYSEESRHALRWASAIAQHGGGELTVLSVVEPLLAQAAGIRLGVDNAHAEDDSALRDFVEATLPERVRQASHVPMELAVGVSPDVIVQTGRKLSAELIVMGTHGRGGFRKLVLGSTTEQVLRQTERPVLAVPPGAGDAPAVDDPDIQGKTILVATDFRESAMAATQLAADLASDLNVPLVLAHVVEPLNPPSQWQALAAEFEDDRIASGQRMLARLSASLRARHIEYVVSLGRPADSIASLTRAYGARLVVMGLANPEDWDQRKPGSIAYRVLRVGHVAVVVVPTMREPRPTSQAIGMPGPSIEHLAES